MSNNVDRMRILAGSRLDLAVLSLTLGLWSCSEDATGPSDLTSGKWELQSMELSGAPRFVPDDPERFTVEFNAGGRIGVVADCNQCGGSYSVSDARLTVSSLACTLVACSTPEGEQFTSLIDGVSSVDKDGDDRLEIQSTEGTLVLTR